MTLTSHFQSRIRFRHAHFPVFGSEHSTRSSRSFFGRVDEPGYPARLPLPQWAARLNFYTISRLRNYEARTVPLSLQPRVSWFTLLYWQQLLDEYRPVPWAPAVMHMKVDLGAVRV